MFLVQNNRFIFNWNFCGNNFFLLFWWFFLTWGSQYFSINFAQINLLFFNSFLKIQIVGNFFKVTTKWVTFILVVVVRINLGYLPNTNCWELLVTTMVQTKLIAQSTKGPFENSEKQILLPFRHLYQVVRQVLTPLFPLGWDSPSFSITIFFLIEKCQSQAEIAEF